MNSDVLCFLSPMVMFVMQLDTDTQMTDLDHTDELTDEPVESPSESNLTSSIPKVINLFMPF